MTAPYYQDEYVTLYHGDCRDVLQEQDCQERFEEAMAIVTDPPYGVSMKRGDSRNRDRVAGDGEPFDPAFLLAWDVPTVLFGANNFADRLPTSTGWLVWDKTFPDMAHHSQVELAWTNCVRTIRIWREAYHGFMRAKDGWLHPTQKPVELFQWILAKLPPTRLVVDPFMGSGSCIVAAKNLGIKSIGIDIDERYCEATAQRLSQSVLDFGGAA